MAALHSAAKSLRAVNCLNLGYGDGGCKALAARGRTLETAVLFQANRQLLGGTSRLYTHSNPAVGSGWIGG